MAASWRLRSGVTYAVTFGSAGTRTGRDGQRAAAAWLRHDRRAAGWATRRVDGLAGVGSAGDGRPGDGRAGLGSGGRRGYARPRRGERYPGGHRIVGFGGFA